MKRKNALYFSNDLQFAIDDFVKDLVYINGKKFLRVAIPKQWRGRAIAFQNYVQRKNYRFTFVIDSFHPTENYRVLFNSYKDDIMYFELLMPVKWSGIV
jgi:hypothetical protein